MFDPKPARIRAYLDRHHCRAVSIAPRPPHRPLRALPAVYAGRVRPGDRLREQDQGAPISRTRTTHATARLVAASVTLGAVLATAAMLVALLFGPAPGPGHLSPGPPSPVERGPRVTVTSSSQPTSLPAQNVAVRDPAVPAERHRGYAPDGRPPTIAGMAENELHQIIETLSSLTAAQGEPVTRYARSGEAFDAGRVSGAITVLTWAVDLLANGNDSDNHDHEREINRLLRLAVAMLDHDETMRRLLDE